MTEMNWYKRFNGTWKDPKFKAAAVMSGATRCETLSVWDAILEESSESEKRGTIIKVDLRVIAAGLDLAADLVERILSSFVELSMIAGEQIASWAKRQGAAAAKFAERATRAITPAAARQRKHREKVAAARREPEFPGFSAAVTSVTPGVTGVTRHVTSAAEEEGRAKRIPTPSLNTESLKGMTEGFEIDEGIPFGRDAPLEGNVVKMAGSPALKAKKKEMRRQKVMRFLGARFSGEDLRIRMEGMLGADPVRDEQWWFDKCDAEMRLANWDDIRDKDAGDAWQMVS